MQVLVVDDEWFMRTLLSLFLQRAGHRVRGAANGAAALAAFSDRPADFILLDLRMPGMDGVQVCAALRQRADVPIIVVTALSDPDTISRSFEAGADDFITKPVTFKELQARMAAVWRRVEWSRARRRDGWWTR